MRRIIQCFILMSVFLSCHKEEKVPPVVTCDIDKAYMENESKLTITQGIWGTVAFMEGNCMPMIPPATTTCKTCPVKRTIRIYNYTLNSQASPQDGHGFYDSFSTQLIKEFETDDNGFFQTELPTGSYTIVVIENGKLYTFGFDGQGGLSPVNYTGGKQKVNLTLRYKAVF